MLIPPISQTSFFVYPSAFIPTTSYHISWISHLSSVITTLSHTYPPSYPITLSHTHIISYLPAHSQTNWKQHQRKIPPTYHPPSLIISSLLPYHPPSYLTIHTPLSHLPPSYVSSLTHVSSPRQARGSVRGRSLERRTTAEHRSENRGSTGLPTQHTLSRYPINIHYQHILQTYQHLFSPIDGSTITLISSLQLPSSPLPPP